MTLPYTMETNDIPMMLVQHHESDYLARRTIDQFERLHAEGANRAKIVVARDPPYISGQPHRIKYLEQIYEHVAKFDGVLHWNGRTDPRLVSATVKIVGPAKHDRPNAKRRIRSVPSGALTAAPPHLPERPGRLARRCRRWRRSRR